MSGSSKHPYRVVLPTAQHIMETLRPYCHRIAIAGSLRRKRPFIGDIELVALPKRQTDLFGEINLAAPSELDRYLDSVLSEKHIIKNGALYKQFQYGRFKVDLFLPASAQHWGAIYMIRTGSHEFNTWVMSRYAPSQGVYFREGLVYGRDGTQFDTAEEDRVFAALGLDFIPPQMRDAEKWKQ